jgi:IS1 family transposase
MQTLATSTRAAVLRCLIEGNSILSTSRITGVAKNSIVKLLADVGDACSAYMHKELVNLPCSTLQLDEIWSFVGCKEAQKLEAINEHQGDIWTWTALCADTKLIPSWRIGDRSGTTAYAFCADLATRFTGRLQISTDGHPAYQWAVGCNFDDVDYARLVKIYGKGKDGKDVCIGARKEPVLGSPDIDLVSTSYVERANLTIRMGNRRFTRLTNAFSKKVENHCHMFALTIMNYNFCRKHTTIKKTPAQAAGVASHQWTLDEVIQMMDAYLAERSRLQFEHAFTMLKFHRARTTPKTFAPVAPRTPWYLDPESGGPEPDVRKPGIAYRTDLS